MDFLRLNIKHLRTLRGLTQAQLAEILSVSRDNIASYERGTNPPVEVVHTIVNYFHVRFNDIMEKDLSLFESKNVDGVIINMDRSLTKPPNLYVEEDMVMDPALPYKTKAIQALERVIDAQEITIQSQKETIQALQNIIGLKSGQVSKQTAVSTKEAQL
jgi:transcriptional regulator with XRE-family HTH domain